MRGLGLVVAALAGVAGSAGSAGERVPPTQTLQRMRDGRSPRRDVAGGADAQSVQRGQGAELQQELAARLRAKGSGRIASSASTALTPPLAAEGERGAVDAAVAAAGGGDASGAAARGARGVTEEAEAALPVRETIPRTLFYFWNHVDPPTTEAAFISRTRTLNGARWNLTQLHLGHDLILSGEMEPPPIPGLSYAHIADWYRLVAIARYGGVWMDVDTVSFHTIESWVDMTSDAVVQGFTSPSSDAQMENWAFAAPAGSEFTRRWLEEYRLALTMGPEIYMSRDETLKHEIMTPDNYLGTYLLQHAAWAVVRHRDLPDAKVLLTRSTAEGQPFGLQAYCEWDSQCVVDQLFSRPATNWSKTPFVKLRGAERQYVGSLAEHADGGSWLAKELLEGVPRHLEYVDYETVTHDTTSAVWIAFGAIGIVTVVVGGVLGSVWLARTCWSTDCCYERSGEREGDDGASPVPVASEGMKQPLTTAG